MNPYPANLRRHSTSSPHRGVLPQYTIFYRAQNHACGDVVEVQGIVDTNRILQAMKFSGEGCMVSQAAISLLIDKIQAMSVEAIFKISCCDMRDMIALDLGPTRFRCVSMALTAVHKALEQGGYRNATSRSDCQHYCSIDAHGGPTLSRST